MSLTIAELRKLVLTELPEEPVKVEALTVPEWKNATINIRVLDSLDRDWFEQTVHQATSEDRIVRNFRALLCCLTICDEAGKRVFKNHEVEKLGNLPSPGISRVFDAAQSLNGISDDSVEQAEKNSESVAGNDSGTSSLRTSECPSPDADAK